MHTALGPSNAHRFEQCAYSVAPSTEEDTSSVHADLGTAAHGLLELATRIGRPPQRFIGTKMHKEHVADDNMIAAVEHATDWLRGYLARNKKAHFHIEYKVQLSGVYGVKRYEQGTGDLIVDNWPEELVTADYKHGIGHVVEVENNPQHMLYAAGYQHETGRVYKRYRMIVIQPRARHKDGPIREWVCTHEELMAFVEKMRKRVREIERNPNQAKAGTWCTFCKQAKTCRTRSEYILELATLEFSDDEPEPIDPKLLTPSQVAWILQHGPMIKDWYASVLKQALTDALSGHPVPGYKLVLGPSKRSFPEHAHGKVRRALLSEGFELDDFEPRKLIGVPGIEKLFKARKRGAKLPKNVINLIAYSKPSLHLAHKDDRRKEYKRGEEFDDAVTHDDNDEEV